MDRKGEYICEMEKILESRPLNLIGELIGQNNSQNVHEVIKRDMFYLGNALVQSYILYNGCSYSSVAKRQDLYDLLKSVREDHDLTYLIPKMDIELTEFFRMHKRTWMTIPDEMREKLETTASTLVNLVNLLLSTTISHWLQTDEIFEE